VIGIKGWARSFRTLYFIGFSERLVELLRQHTPIQELRIAISRSQRQRACRRHGIRHGRLSSEDQSPGDPRLRCSGMVTMTLADEAQYLLTKHTRQLFDMDGTIIDSTPAIIKYWLQMGENIGVDGNGTQSMTLCHQSLIQPPFTAFILKRADHRRLPEILKTSHGRRSIDVLSILAPNLANWDCKLPPWPSHTHES
jgi:hypothetical protein